jgi:hypothetical protein
MPHSHLIFQAEWTIIQGCFGSSSRDINADRLDFLHWVLLPSAQLPTLSSQSGFASP